MENGIHPFIFIVAAVLVLAIALAVLIRARSRRRRPVEPASSPMAAEYRARNEQQRNND